ncbi:MAG: choice-of-anchor D domain-containing protein [Planctomycetes bacterium]|nr:choice-of-anchor D domain-containing protein [Planctomycetota bacterium]
MRALRSRSALDALLSGLAARWRCARKRGQQHRRSHRPVLERLELRQLLSVTQFADDQTPAFVPTPNWDAYSGVVGFQGDFCYSITGGGSDAAKWTFDVTPGQYRVAATWVENATYWSTQSPFTILDGAIPRGVALVNQRQAPDDMVDADAAWEQLGDVYNITGTSLVVQLTNADDGYVIADGIRIERIGDLPAAADISVVEGNVELVQDAGGIDFGTLLTNRSVIKTFTVVNQGSAPLELSNSIAVPFGFSVVTPLGATTLGLGESTTFSVQLGAASADNYAGQIAVASNDPDQPVFNINVSGLVRGVQILDDGMAGVQSGAVWVAGQTVLGFDGDVRYTLAVPGSEVDSTVWTFPVKPGKYRVAATWFASPFFAPDATFSIFDGDAPLGTVSVNQQQTPNDLTDLGKAWENLGGVYTVTGSTLVVKLSNIGTGYVFADAVRIEGQDNINNLRLVRDTGISSTDFITTDRRITGTVASDGPTAGILVSIDLDGDDGPEALILTDALGRFNYTPPNSTPGPYTVRVRSQKWDPALLDYVYGSWATVNFMLQTAANAPLSVTSLSLLNPSGGPPSLPRTTDPTLTGKVANDGPIGGLRVEFDFDGNDTVDAFTRTDAAGEFVYRPMGLATGRQWTVRARASEWNETTQLFTPSAWKSLTFQLDPVEPPAVSLLRLIEDDGESPTDLQTTNPRLTGTVTAQGSVFGLTVEFDHNADGVPEGTALTDYEGNFTYFPQGLDPGQIVIHARARSAAELSNQQTVGPWVAFAFTLVGSTPASVVDLRLLNDTGESDTDSITTDPRLTGRVLREGVQARFSVEFDHNGDGSPDGAVMTDLSGNFRYTPLGLRPGLLSVGARAVTWDASTSRNLYGDFPPLMG